MMGLSTSESVSGSARQPWSKLADASGAGPGSESPDSLLESELELIELEGGGSLLSATA